MATWIDGQRACCGPLADAASMFAAHLGVEDDPPAGVQGLVALTRALRKHRAAPEAAEDDDRAFVELAGAYLALVLRDALAQGEHVRHADGHGLHLGTRGYFDPFAAIEDALDAGDVRTCLAAWVREAEAEAVDRGPYARASAVLLDELRTRFAEVELLERSGPELALRVDGAAVRIDVRRIASLARESRDEPLARAARKLIAAVPALREESRPEYPQAQRSLLPRLIGPGFFDGVAQGGGRMLSAPLVPGIDLACVLRQEGRARFVDQSDLARWGQSERAVLEAALHNLATRSARARLERHDGEGVTLIVARTGDGLDASRLLLPGLHDVLAPELGSPFVAAVPHRDALFACPRDCERSLRTLRDRAAREAASAAHAISAQPLLVGAGGRLRALEHAPV